MPPKRRCGPNADNRSANEKPWLLRRRYRDQECYFDAASVRSPSVPGPYARAMSGESNQPE